MLRGLIISPDATLGNQLEDLFYEIGKVGIARNLDRYPSNVELTRVTRAYAPQVAFVSIASIDKAVEIAQELERIIPGIQIVAIHNTCNPQILLDLMRAGIREFLSPPFSRQAVLELVQRLTEILDKRPAEVETTDLVFSFLPSKAGVGTTITAVNTSVALSKIPDTSVLLMDFDLSSGIIRFLLKLDNGYSITDAAEHAQNMDENLWPQLVTSFGSLDILHAGKINPGWRIEALQLRNLLDFTRRNYKVICVDLSGNMEKYSVEIMQESKRVFLVCTQEIPSLHLAREKLSFLKNLELMDRVSVIISRVNKRSVITTDQVEELLGVPVQIMLPNDYLGVHRSLTEGRPIDFSTELGKKYTQLAHSLLDKKVPAAEAKRRFVEYFSILPARYSLGTESRRPAV